MNNENNLQNNNDVGGMSSVFPNVGGNASKTQEQNNNVGVGGGQITPITPVNVIDNNMVNNLSSNSEIQSGTIPIAPMPEVKDNSVSQNQTASGVIPITPDNVVPQSNNLENTVVTPELKVDSSSPFDIGLNQSVPLNTEPLVQTPVSNVNNNAVETITPVDLTIEDKMDEPQSSVMPTGNNDIINNNVSNNENVVSVGSYLGHMLLFSIPVIGIIMLLVKAFGKGNKNISNLAKAQLLLMIIMVVLGIVLSVVFSAFIINIGSPIMY